MPEIKDKLHEGDSTPPQPSQKMQWAYFWALIGITCLIIGSSIGVFLLSGNPWSFVLDFLGIPPGVLWARIAMHLFPIDLRERELEIKREAYRRYNRRKSV